MKKLVIGLLTVLVMLACIPLALIATGTIDSSSVRMILNVMTGMGGPPATATGVKQRFQLPPGFKLSMSSASAWIEEGFRRPR